MPRWDADGADVVDVAECRWSAPLDVVDGVDVFFGGGGGGGSGGVFAE